MQKRNLLHQLTAQRHIENSKNKNGDNTFAVAYIAEITDGRTDRRTGHSI